MKIRQLMNTKIALTKLKFLLKPYTRKVLSILSEGDFNQTQIYIKARDWEQCEISTTLGRLVDYGLITERRDGKFMIYSIVPAEIEKINRICKELAEIHDEVEAVAA